MLDVSKWTIPEGGGGGLVEKSSLIDYGQKYFLNGAVFNVKDMPGIRVSAASHVTGGSPSYMEL